MQLPKTAAAAAAAAAAAKLRQNDKSLLTTARIRSLLPISVFRISYIASDRFGKVC